MYPWEHCLAYIEYPVTICYNYHCCKGVPHTRKFFFRWNRFGFSYSWPLIAFLCAEITQTKAILPSTQVPPQMSEDNDPVLLCSYIIKESFLQRLFLLWKTPWPSHVHVLTQIPSFQMPFHFCIIDVIFYPCSVCIKMKGLSAGSHSRVAVVACALFILATQHLAQNSYWMNEVAYQRWMGVQQKPSLRHVHSISLGN